MSAINKFLITILGLIVICIIIGSHCSDANAQNMFDSNGKPFTKRQGRTQEPKIIIDTVQIVAGWGELRLQPRYSSTRHRTTPTDKFNIFCTITQILDDSTKTVYAYGYLYIPAESRVLVKSKGGTADTGKVAIITVLK